MKNDKMPDGYRHLMVESHAGTGNGDEVWSLGLQKFETRPVRRGIWPFRRTERVTKWWTVEVFGFGIPSRCDYAAAHRSAWTRYHSETGGVHA